MADTAERTCPYCTTLLTGRRVQCGAPDCRRRWQNDRLKQFQARWKAEHGERYEARYYSTARRWACLACGKSHGSYGSDRNRRFCDHACRDRWKRRCSDLAARRGLPLEGRRQRAAGRRLAKAAAGSAGATWNMGWCLRCGAQFVTRRLDSRYCSPACKASDSSSRRRVRQRGVKLTSGRRHRVFEQDQWTCHLCHRKVRRRTKVPHPLAPTIDHVIPLAELAARGESDGPWNWRTAHFLCNSQKQAGFVETGEQLRWC